MYHSFSIHLYVDVHPGCLHVLAIVNSAAMNIWVRVSFSGFISSGYMPRSGIPGSYGGFMPGFLRSLHTVFHNDCISLHYKGWGFFPRDLEATNLKEGHLDSLLQGLTSLFLQSSPFTEVGTKSLEYSQQNMYGLTPNR